MFREIICWFKGHKWNGGGTHRGYVYWTCGRCERTLQFTDETMDESDQRILREISEARYKRFVERTD